MPAFDYSAVADIYDAYVRTDLDVPFFIEESLRASGPVLELMCGTGRLSLPLIRAGIPLTCVDISPDMLSELRRKLAESGLTANIVEQDVAVLSLKEQFDLALLPFNSFSELTSPDDQLSALRSIRTCLRPGGRLILTLHNPPVRLTRVTGEDYEIGRFPIDSNMGSTLIVRLKEFHDPVSNLVTGVQRFEAVSSDGHIEWSRSVNIAYRLVSENECLAMAAEAGFETEGLYGSYDRSVYREVDSPFMIWSLRAVLQTSQLT